MFYTVRTTKRVDDVGNVTLVAQYLLSSHSHGHCLFRRRSVGFVERVSVQRLSTSQGCRQGFQGRPHNIIMRLLCGEAASRGLSVEAKHPGAGGFGSKPLSH